MASQVRQKSRRAGTQSRVGVQAGILNLHRPGGAEAFPGPMFHRHQFQGRNPFVIGEFADLAAGIASCSGVTSCNGTVSVVMGPPTKVWRLPGGANEASATFAQHGAESLRPLDTLTGSFC